MRIGGLLALLTGAVLAGPTDDEIRDAARRVFESSEYQTEMPNRAAPPSPPPDRANPVDWRDDPGDLEVDPPDRRAVESVARAIGWVLAAVVIVAVLCWVLRDVRTSKRERNAVPAPVPAPVRAGDRPDPAALAEAGEFGEAIRALLLLLLPSIQRDESLTSREILARAPFERTGRDALAALVAAVEISHFGGVPAGPADYDRCRKHYDSCREALGRRAA